MWMKYQKNRCYWKISMNKLKHGLYFALLMISVYSTSSFGMIVGYKPFKKIQYCSSPLTPFYRFHKNSVRFALQYHEEDLFEFLIKKDHFNVNNHWDDDYDDDCHTIVESIIDDIEQLNIPQERKEKAIDFCKKNGCKTQKEISLKPLKALAKKELFPENLSENKQKNPGFCMVQ
jgi:hypothetical protein